MDRIEGICYECAMEKGGRPAENGVVSCNQGYCTFCKTPKMVSHPLKYKINLLSEETKERLKLKLCV